MTKTQNNLLQEYAALKAQQKEVEANLEAMEPKVLSLLEKTGVDTLQENYGTFSVVYRKRWTFSDALMEKEKQYSAIIKQDKSDEQDNGEAKAEESKSLSYRKYEEKI